MQLKQFKQVTDVLAVMPFLTASPVNKKFATQLIKFAGLVPHIVGSKGLVVTTKTVAGEEFIKSLPPVAKAWSHSWAVNKLAESAREVANYTHTEVPTYCIVHAKSDILEYTMPIPANNDFCTAFLQALGVEAETVAKKEAEEPTHMYSLPIAVIEHMKLACLHCLTEADIKERHQCSPTRITNMEHVRLEILADHAQVIATNGHQIYTSNPYLVSGPAIALNIPVAIVKQLALATCLLEVWHRASGDHEYRIGGNLVKDITHEYPDWKLVIPTVEEHIEVEVDLLKPAITQAVLKTKDCLKKDGKYAKVTPTKLIIDEATLKLSTTYLEDNTATVSEVRHIVNKTNRTIIAADARKLETTLKSLDLRTTKTIKIHMKAGREMLLFKTPYQTVLLMPILLPS